MAWQLPAEWVAWIVALSQPPHGRLAWRLLPLPRGVLFAQGRRTVASWLRAAGLGQDFRSYSYFLGRLRPRAWVIAAVLPRLAVGVSLPGERLLFGLDDTLYGAPATQTFQTFRATYPPAGGRIRVVVVREPHGWVAFLGADPPATVTQILEAVADRGAIEQDFPDRKEVHGTGQPPVRHYGATVAVFPLNLWLHPLIERRAWTKTQGQWCDRRDRPWDRADRRPSHADRRNALRRQGVPSAIRQVGRRRPRSRKGRDLCRSLLKLAAWA